MKNFPVICGVVLLVLSLPVGAAQTPADLVAKFPTNDVGSAQAVLAEIIQAGPAAVKDLCKLLAPEGKGNAKAEYALNGLATYAARPGAEADRKLVAGALIEALAAEDRTEIQMQLIAWIQVCGHDEAVAPLAKYLADEKLYEPATRALQRIGSAAAIRALGTALPGAKDKARLSLIQALGELRDKDSAKAILPDASAEDVTLRLTALHALANIGDAAAADALAKAAKAENLYQRSQAIADYLLLADRLAQDGAKDAAAKICRDLLKAPAGPRENNVAAAALATLVRAIGPQAAGEVLAAVDSPSIALRFAALRLTASMGADVSAKLVAKMKDARPEVQAEILDVLSRRGDEAVLPAVIAALKDNEKATRLAAIAALVRFKSAQVVPELLAVLQSNQADEVKAAKDAMMRLDGDAVLTAAADSLRKVPPASRVALLELLGARRAASHVQAVLACAKDADPQSRLAAIKALGELAEAQTAPAVVELLLNAQGEAEQAAAQKALVAVCNRNADADARAQPVLAALGEASGAKRIALLKALGRLGGAGALRTILADAKSSDADIQDAAIRALTDWPDASAAAAMLEVARAAAKPAYRVLALRGFVRVMTLPSERPAAQSVALYKKAMAVASAADEKKLVLAGLASVRSEAALQVVAPCLDEPTLQAEACLAAVKIACPEGPYKGLKGPQVTAVLKKVIEVTADDNIRNQAKKHIGAK